MKVLSIFLLSLLLFTQFHFDKNNSSIIIKGDSSMHEWKMELTKFNVEHKWDGEKLSYIKLICPVIALKSDKEKMDENTMEAMDEEKYPTITFESNKIHQDEKGNISAKGKLKITHIEKEVTIKGAISKEDHMFKISGSYDIDMLDYDISPPTAMFGMMKVDKEIVVDFKLNFKL